MRIADSDLDVIHAAIDSVRAQCYDSWSLVLIAPKDGAPDITALLEQLATGNKRISIKAILGAEDNEPECVPTEESRSEPLEWVVLTDTSSVLNPCALFWFAHEISHNPEVVFIYVDSDAIDSHGKRRSPQFKPDWNYDLLLSYDYIGIPFALRWNQAAQSGTLRHWEISGAHYDAVLRFVELGQANEIGHIPRVLSHRQYTLDSPTTSLTAADLAALRAHLHRRKIAASVQEEPISLSHALRHVRYALPSPAPHVTIVIPTRNQVELLCNCIESIGKHTDYPRYDFIVVDNGSDDPLTLAYLRKLSTTDGFMILRDDGPFNFSRLNNRAVDSARGDVVALVNNDIEAVTADWLTEMVSTAIQPGVGAVGARLLYPDGRLQHGGVILGLGGLAGHAHKYFKNTNKGYMQRAVVKQTLSAVTAACLVVSRSRYLEVGGLNETDLAVAFNDVDFCLRLRAKGYRNIYAPRATLIHHESVSRGEDDTPEKSARFKQELDYMLDHWSEELKSDPAYSPNLTLQREDFTLAWPPRLPISP